MRDMGGMEGARWRKASRSDHQGGACVEVARLADVIGVRDSKDADGPKLIVTAAEWKSFVGRVTAREYDLR
ncbi:DUF397 domain-containing protein [Spirillospora sp. NPDC048824]|uniref:DUF397 domain-containing protein n=1 Tax=Spirillospora sp. NPDC048824 TaxID=3364526 RepID=UPI00371076E9